MTDDKLVWRQLWLGDEVLWKRLLYIGVSLVFSQVEPIVVRSQAKFS
jgi:hypothetical protein